MKKVAVLGLLAMSCLLASGASSARVVVGVGIGVPIWGPGYYPHGYYPPAYYPPPPVYYSPPPVYVERIEQPPPVYTQQAAPTTYRYYCQETGAYYPQVQSCPGNWLPVSPNNLPGNIPPPP
jgi:hypothetical protein